ncbi:MAG TPA: hypothetical protein VMU39_07785 [Solirubrobacteraceae bacterium]|nr:hypothetical protein [Solirubrobacteraceae bacterium]
MKMRGEMHISGRPSSHSLAESQNPREDQPALELAAEGGTQVVWEDRWHEEEIFANRLSFYILAQSFLVVAAVMATLSGAATSRWLPVALTIDLTGLVVTVVFWYAFTENLRRLDALKQIVSEGSAEVGVRGYKEIAAIRAAHHENRSRRALPILPRWSPSWWLAHGIPAFLGSMWVGLLVEAIVGAA